MKQFLFAIIMIAVSPAFGETIRCSWQPTNFKTSTYLSYNTRSKVLVTRSGWYKVVRGKVVSSRGAPCPVVVRGGQTVQYVDHTQCARVYTGVQVLSGLPPYYEEGISLVGFDGEVPFAHLKLTFNAISQGSSKKKFPYEAKWGLSRLPATPGRAAGVCWTNKMPGKERLNDN